MTDTSKVVSDATDQIPVGDVGGNSSGQPSGSDLDKVSYETHRRLLGEKKKLEARLEEIERANKEKETQALKVKEDYKKLYEQEAEENKSKDEKLKTWERKQEYSIKINAFLNKLDGDLDEEYFMHVDTDKLILNPETGKVDEISLERLVKEFKEKHYKLIEKPTNFANLPKDHPRGGSMLSYDAWLKLPLKERRATMKEVMQTHQKS